ncbi:hypothetical protein OBV_11460 [Oscillibacter valericigenes Sjm18-20]|nr:hypothetical protein OBV_11460 [Oscillibacter valericigenes Sjm18-20]
MPTCLYPRPACGPQNGAGKKKTTGIEEQGQKKPLLIQWALCGVPAKQEPKIRRRCPP